MATRALRNVCIADEHNADHVSNNRVIRLPISRFSWNFWSRQWEASMWGLITLSSLSFAWYCSNSIINAGLLSVWTVLSVCLKSLLLMNEQTWWKSNWKLFYQFYLISEAKAAYNFSLRLMTRPNEILWFQFSPQWLKETFRIFEV